MNQIFTIIFYFLSILFISSCNFNKDSNTNNGPDIYIISPVSQDLNLIDSLIKINAVVADNEGVHDVLITIKNDYLSSEETKIFYDHIHDSAFDIDTSFIVSIPTKNEVTYTVEILAKDMLGNSNNQSVKLNVKNYE